jgi:hypothetical protein
MNQQRTTIISILLVCLGVAFIALLLIPPQQPLATIDEPRKEMDRLEAHRRDLSSIFTVVTDPVTGASRSTLSQSTLRNAVWREEKPFEALAPEQQEELRARTRQVLNSIRVHASPVHSRITGAVDYSQDVFELKDLRMADDGPYKLGELVALAESTLGTRLARYIPRTGRLSEETPYLRNGVILMPSSGTKSFGQELPTFMRMLIDGYKDPELDRVMQDAFARRLEVVSAKIGDVEKAIKAIELANERTTQWNKLKDLVSAILIVACTILFFAAAGYAMYAWPNEAERFFEAVKKTAAKMQPPSDSSEQKEDAASKRLAAQQGQEDELRTLEHEKKVVELRAEIERIKKSIAPTDTTPQKRRSRRIVELNELIDEEIADIEAMKAPPDYKAALVSLYKRQRQMGTMEIMEGKE